VSVAVQHPDMHTIYVNFFCNINDVSANKFMAACAEIIRVEDPDCLYFLFASSGGGVDAGIAIYNYLRALPIKIIMHNTGAIDSIANVIFHAADERYANPHSTFLFHGVMMPLEKGNLNRSQLQELLNQISALENKIANILAGRCQLLLTEIQSLFLNGETKDTAFALSKGIIQSVSQVAIPHNAKFYSLNFT
jgi:ATP-dependent Clp protease protease subunit